MLVFLRCSLLSEDVRLRKYTEACKTKGIQFNVISWDREGAKNYSEEEIVFKVNAKYGRLWKNIIYKLMWQFFLLFKLFKLHKKIKVIHACDFDTMLPALIYSLISRKKIIYDVYDAISVPNPKGLFQRIIRIFDMMFISFCDTLILADKERIVQMGISNPTNINKVFVVENVPHLIKLPEKRIKQEYFTISYVGVLDRHRGIESLLMFVKDNVKYVLNIAGVGTLTDLVIKSSNECSRIRYHGFVEYSLGMDIMYNSDLIIGMYYPVTLNQKFASPNKFYESLFLGKPLLTSVGTLVGRKVKEFNTGYLVDDNYHSLNECISKIDLNNSVYQDKSKSARLLWDNNYKTYFQKRLCNDYINLVKIYIDNG